MNKYFSQKVIISRKKVVARIKLSFQREKAFHMQNKVFPQNISPALEQYFLFWTFLTLALARIFNSCKRSLNFMRQMTTPSFSSSNTHLLGLLYIYNCL